MYIIENLWYIANALRTICPVTEAESASSAILASYTMASGSGTLFAPSTPSTSATAGGLATSSSPISTEAAVVATPSSNATVPTYSLGTAAGVAATPSVSASNGTVAGPVLSTSTYFQTDVVTITSCAPTVTNCPASKSTTIYPVTTIITSSAEAIATSGSVVLTYTLGTGTSTTVVTTSKQYTPTAFDNITCYNIADSSIF
jgi:hypothetical protein